MRNWFLMLLLALAAATRAEDGSAVVVLYNSNMPESKRVADHYAQKRSVPPAQVIGLPMSDKEAISRDEFRKTLLDPFFKKIEDLKLLTFKPGRYTNGVGKAEDTKLVSEAKIRYAVLCYGVPVKIEPLAGLNEPGTESARPEVRRNEAAVDNELATLPLYYAKPLLTGPLVNQLYTATNAASFNPTNGILMVARLDGPVPENAIGMIDKALQAEREGLWGRAYFDARGLTDGAHKIGDDMILASEKTARRHGWESVLDTNSAIFPDTFPMSHIGLYVGWYEFNNAGAMARITQEFMPGAFAYHLHSFSAQLVRNNTHRWVGPLLARGATATMGCTEEPYLEGTPDIAVFIGRWLFLGFSYGEAAYASQRFLSWQTTVLGDPLYRPFTRRPQDQHEELRKAGSKLIEWSHLRVININQATGASADEIIDYLRQIPETKTSAILTEKLGDVLKSKGKWIEPMEPYEQALKLNPSPQQRLRITLALTSLQTMFSRERQAYDLYKGLIRDYPDYTDKVRIYQKLLALSDKFGTPAETAEFEKALKDLTPAGTSPKP